VLQPPNQGAAANGLSAMRSGVAGVRERAVRSTRAAEAVAELVLVRPMRLSGKWLGDAVPDWDCD